MIDNQQFNKKIRPLKKSQKIKINQEKQKNNELEMKIPIGVLKL